MQSIFKQSYSFLFYCVRFDLIWCIPKTAVQQKSNGFTTKQYQNDVFGCLYLDGILQSLITQTQYFSQNN